MTFSIPRRCCVVTIFATVVCMLSSPLLADLTTARIALQTRQFELALAQAEDLAETHPFDGASVHHPEYNFNDEAIPAGCSWWVEMAETRLGAAQ